MLDEGAAGGLVRYGEEMDGDFGALVPANAADVNATAGTSVAAVNATGGARSSSRPRSGPGLRAGVSDVCALTAHGRMVAMVAW